LLDPLDLPETDTRLRPDRSAEGSTPKDPQRRPGRDRDSLFDRLIYGAHRLRWRLVNGAYRLRRGQAARYRVVRATLIVVLAAISGVAIAYLLALQSTAG
jgi:hypothetical protein